MSLVSKIFAGFLLAFGLIASPVMAQQANGAEATEYSDTQLQKFANASEKVAMVMQEYSPKVQEAGDEDQRQQLLEEADKKMVAHVQDEGLSVEEFNGINTAIQQDPEVLERMQKISNK